MGRLCGILAALALFAALTVSSRDFESVKKSGTLRVLTVYQEEPGTLPRDMSPEDYEMSLLEGFARREGLRLELIRVPGFRELFDGLAEGRGDLAASMLTVTPERQERANFTKPFLTVSEQLVTASGNNSFKDLSSLAGRSVWVQPGTSYERTAESLAKTVPGLVIKRTPESIGQDEIFERTASGEYEFTIADESYVRAFLARGDSVKDVFTFPGKRDIAWALPKSGSAGLQNALNSYIRKSVAFHQLRSYKEDLSELKKRGYIRFLTRNTPHTYCINRGMLTGFEYELAREFASRLGLHPVFVVPPAWGDLFPWLLEGRGEVIAACVTATGKRAAIPGLSLCAPYCVIKEQIIGKKTGAVKTLKDLAGRTIHVRKSGSYWESAVKLRDAGVDIKITAAPEDMETYDILDRIESGGWDLTICDSNIAAVELSFRPSLAVLSELPGEKNYAWIVRTSSPELKAEIDKFFAKENKSAFFNVAHRRYFTPERAASAAREAELAEDSLKLMPYKDLIVKHSGINGFHWCLIAAQILQESRFNPGAVSRSGAVGLMQLLPSTAAELGFKNIHLPEQNIPAGTAYLRSLREKSGFASLRPFDKLCFALASYNGGLGHLLDARKLAASQNLDPDRWLDNVEKAYALLGQEKHHSKTKYGACRQREIIGYVRNIIFYYRMYLREQNPGQLPPDAMP
jgi:membrane-bound lytic murein transglycosylase F